MCSGTLALMASGSSLDWATSRVLAMALLISSATFCGTLSCASSNIQVITQQQRCNAYVSHSVLCCTTCRVKLVVTSGQACLSD